jgi:hypothetical protein
MTYHDGQNFSAKDKDVDKSSGNCAQRYKSGWWYKSCLFHNMHLFVNMQYSILFEPSLLYLSMSIGSLSNYAS